MNSENTNDKILTLKELHEKDFIVIDDNIVYINLVLKVYELKQCPFQQSHSKLEKKMKIFLKKYHKLYREQVSINLHIDYYYDFAITNQNTTILIEIDGKQHFNENSYNYINKKHNRSFKKSQINDCLKTEFAIIKGYKLIRIHYDDIDNISSIMKLALESFSNGKYLYFSRLHQYSYIIDNILLFDISKNIY